MNTREYVSQFYFTDEDIDYAVEQISEKYNRERVYQAVKGNYDLYELDRWEYASSLHEKGLLKDILGKLNHEYTNEQLDEIIKDFDVFTVEITNKLWEEDIEVMELENY